MILLFTEGVSYGIHNDIVGKVINDSSCKEYRRYEVIDNELVNNTFIISTESRRNSKLSGIYKIRDPLSLTKGDIVLLSPNGSVNILFRKNLIDNTLFFTNKCNTNCIMCSQPPQKHNDIPQLKYINEQIIEFLPSDLSYLGISGGEPSLYGKDFYLIISKLINRLPNCEISILTNGLNLSDLTYLDELNNLPKEKLIFCIPINSDYYKIHDEIVRLDGAFYKTIKTIYKLGINDFRIELRIIPQKKNFQRLVKLSNFIYRNLTFVEHIAFMGLEMIGNARKYANMIWISPIELGPILKESVEFLHYSGLNVSLYNYQKCYLPKEIWPFVRNSISDWKQEYLEECDYCKERNVCGGMFFSSKEYLRPFIKRIN